LPRISERIERLDADAFLTVTPGIRQRGPSQHRDARLTKVRHYRVMADRTETEDELKKAEQHEALKQMFLRLLDDPQVQQKIVALLSRRLGQIRGKYSA
jgi:hypothetical protein